MRSEKQWWERSWNWTKSKGVQVRRVVPETIMKARDAGKLAARHVLSLQRAVGLDDRLVQRSAETVINRPMIRESDKQWQAAYKEVAEAQIPGLAKEKEVEIEELEI